MGLQQVLVEHDVHVCILPGSPLLPGAWLLEGFPFTILVENFGAKFGRTIAGKCGGKFGGNFGGQFGRQIGGKTALTLQSQLLPRRLLPWPLP